jgi:hypothetical protein
LTRTLVPIVSVGSIDADGTRNVFDAPRAAVEGDFALPAAATLLAPHPVASSAAINPETHVGAGRDMAEP